MDNRQAMTAKPVIGVDMGGTKILAAVVRGDGKILGRAKKRTKAELGPEEVIARITQTVRQAAQDANTSLAQIATLGIGAPGPLDPPWPRRPQPRSNCNSSNSGPGQQQSHPASA